MRLKALVVMIAAGLPLGACANTVAPFGGNDTGGVIAWSPESQRLRHDLAGGHCASYGKLHRITSVRARYGDYIGFACYRPRGTAADTVVLRRAY